MNVKCAWCGCSMGLRKPYSDATVTHGCCRRCVALQLRQAWSPGRRGFGPRWAR